MKEDRNVLKVSYAGRTTTVALCRNLWAVGERYWAPARRVRDALRRIGAPLSGIGVATDATEWWPYRHVDGDRYYVSFERLK